MAKEEKAARALVTARLLVDATISGKTYRCDTLIAADKKLIDGLRQSGIADASAAAVQYKIDAGDKPVVVADKEDAADEDSEAAV